MSEHRRELSRDEFEGLLKQPIEDWQWELVKHFTAARVDVSRPKHRLQIVQSGAHPGGPIFVQCDFCTFNFNVERYAMEDALLRGGKVFAGVEWGESMTCVRQQG